MLCGERSGGRAALDHVRADLVGRDLFEIGSAVPVAGEPAFGSSPIPGEMQQFRAVAEFLQSADHADRGTLDDLEPQLAVDGVGAADRDNDGTGSPKSPSCRVKQAGDV